MQREFCGISPFRDFYVSFFAGNVRTKASGTNNYIGVFRKSFDHTQTVFFVFGKDDFNGFLFVNCSWINGCWQTVEFFSIKQIGSKASNCTGDFVVVQAANQSWEFQQIKGFFKGATVGADKRKDGTVDVLVGDKYGGFNKKAPKAVTVKSAKACLPPSQSATPAAN